MEMALKNIKIQHREEKLADGKTIGGQVSYTKKRYAFFDRETTLILNLATIQTYLSRQLLLI